MAEGQAKEPLTDLVAAWDKGDAVGRCELLAQLFTDIHILHGRVSGYSPRPDRAPDLIRKIDLIVKRCLSAWAVMDSNQRPPRCKRGALPIELTARRGCQSNQRRARSAPC